MDSVIVVKRDDQISIHKDWEKAKEVYGFLGELSPLISGYSIREIPLGVTINCFILLDHCTNDYTIQSFEETKNGTCMVEFLGPLSEFRVEVDTITKAEEANTIDGQEESPAHEWEEAEKVCRAFETTDDGEVDIKIDAWTEQELLNLIDLSE